MPVDAKQFKSALGRFASGVTVITVGGEAGDHGMTASAFCSLSLDPPLVLVCVKNGNTTHGKLLEATGFGVNILSSEQQHLSNRFAGYGPPMDDRFSDLDVARGAAGGAPLIGGSLAGLDCTLYGTRDGGDHTIFIGQVEGVTLGDDADPLIYSRGYRALVPKDA